MIHKTFSNIQPGPARGPAFAQFVYPSLSGLMGGAHVIHRCAISRQDAEEAKEYQHNADDKEKLEGVEGDRRSGVRKVER